MTWLCTLCLAGSSGTALAACTRPLQVPVAALGHSVVIRDNHIQGIYPDLLRTLSTQKGCELVLKAVPRARQEMLFSQGKADLLLPATRTPARDKWGTFVPLIRNRVTLISLDSNRPPIKSIQELLDHPSIRVVLVRGYDYGDVYQDMVQRLEGQKRVIFEADPLSVGRVLKANPDDVTLMVPTILSGAMQEDVRTKDMVGSLRLEPLPEFPWGESGIYVSKTSLNAHDKAQLLDLLQQAAQSGALWKAFQAYYPAEVLKDSIKPR